ncbi:MAG: hypothetical protein FGM33_06290 [Candidatus Kapabacteria bacterium]|nr:hypothetical protein [Candidatus Kapabacteria bacterium]
MSSLRYLFLFVDIGFIVYWFITALHLIPAEFVYNDYANPILVNWNWSFFPLDLLVSATGLYSIWLSRRKDVRWRSFALISLVLTSTSGLQAISYWVLAGEFDPTWWTPNLFLLVYPLFFIPRLIDDSNAEGFPLSRE